LLGLLWIEGFLQEKERRIPVPVGKEQGSKFQSEFTISEFSEGSQIVFFDLKHWYLDVEYNLCQPKYTS
jgi:hypothetical protein